VTTRRVLPPIGAPSGQTVRVRLLDGLLRRPQTERPPQVRTRSGGPPGPAGPAGPAGSIVATPRETQEHAWRQEVARHEWIVLHVSAGESGTAAYQYTVGLTGRGLPEVVVYGLRLKTGMLVLDDLATRLLDGEEFADGVDVPDLLPATPGTRLWDVTWLQDPLDAASRLYGDAVRVRQLVVPDPRGRLPFDAAFETPHLQPVLFVPPNGGAPRPTSPPPVVGPLP